WPKNGLVAWQVPALDAGAGTRINNTNLSLPSPRSGQRVRQPVEATRKTSLKVNMFRSTSAFSLKCLAVASYLVRCSCRALLSTPSPSFASFSQPLPFMDLFISYPTQYNSNDARMHGTKRRARMTFRRDCSTLCLQNRPMSLRGNTVKAKQRFCQAIRLLLRGEEPFWSRNITSNTQWRGLKIGERVAKSVKGENCSDMVH
ncbi:hypothetical protein BDV96DRAFT_658010, partial [Lophiotrema nucula]